MIHSSQVPGSLPGSGANPCTWRTAKSSLERLDRWLARRQLSWLEDLAIAWLDTDRDVVFAMSGSNAIRAYLDDAQTAARHVFRAPAEVHNAALMQTAANTVLGSVAATGRAREENYLVVCLLAELVLDPGIPDEFLQLLVEERFIEHSLDLPDVPFVVQPGISSQAGFAAVRAGAALEGLLPGQRFGWPRLNYGVPPLEPGPPRPMPIGPLIDVDQIPGVNSGLS